MAGDIVRYTPAQLHHLRDSPLVQRPDGLPSIEQWMEPQPPQMLVDIPRELLFRIAEFLDCGQRLALASVCQYFNYLFERPELYDTLRKLRCGKISKDGQEIANLLSTSRSFLLEVEFRRHGPGASTELLLRHGADFNQVPCGLPRLIQDTLREAGHIQHTLFLLEHGVDPEEVCKLLEDMYCGSRAATNMQLLRHHGAVFDLPAKLPKVSAETRCKLGYMYHNLCELSADPSLVIVLFNKLYRGSGDGTELPRADLRAGRSKE
ncbi:uncharacterized protein BDZ99DRAFT_482797 [Mytilinidion resinicola]|uniref:F-box domain-containing protein n=1 Tax=Mytilinidion resinicola TaxID=574789 RepID=A0A6A6Y377_9PEZI|nr:uncharacterized protein BDZ99DRAFT_482797 [Mytilinidion resinicola]KAF2802675.1 hypothetical protein BDZ99DRAFT_482797 [Mytilinidion resinicola]